MNKIASASIITLLLLGCAELSPAVDSAADAVNACAYLANYATEAKEHLQDKEYQAALAVVNAAYFKTLETPGAPCLKDAKDLVKLVYELVVKGVKESETQQ